MTKLIRIFFIFNLPTSLLSPIFAIFLGAKVTTFSIDFFQINTDPRDSQTSLDDARLVYVDFNAIY